jgi:hypothetical protein
MPRRPGIPKPTAPSLVTDAKGAQSDVEKFTRDWYRLRRQKMRTQGGVEARILLNLCMYYGEHYAAQATNHVLTEALKTDEERNRLRLVFNMVKRATRRRIGRIWGVQHGFRAIPNTRDPRAMDRADVVRNLVRGTDFQLQQKDLLWTKLFWVLVGGVAVEDTCWVPDAITEPMSEYDEATGELLFKDNDPSAPRDEQGQPIPIPMSVRDQMIQQGAPLERFEVYETIKLVGDIGAHIVDPLRFFVDNSVLRLKDLAPDQAYYTAEIKTIGWIQQVFGTDLDADTIKKIQRQGAGNLGIISMQLTDRNGPSYAGTNMRDLIPAIQGSRAEDDPDMAIVLKRVQPAHEGFPHGRQTFLVPGGGILHDGEIPYPFLPATDTHWDPRATCFFSGDFITDLVAPQKFINRRMSQLGEAANNNLNEILLLGSQISKDELAGDVNLAIENSINEQGIPMIQTLQRSPVQGWFVESIRMVFEVFEHLSGADLTSFSSRMQNLRGSMGLPIMQEIQDSEDGPFFTHMGEQEARVRQKRIEVIRDYYPPKRTLHYLGSDMRHEVLDFHTDDTLRAGYDFTIAINPETVVPELASMREERIRTRMGSPIGMALYLNKRTNKIDPSKIARDLHYSDEGRESREEQYRKMARQLVSMIMRGEPLPEGIPHETWDHDVMLDEYEASFATLEFWDDRLTSAKARQILEALYDAQREILSAMHDKAQAGFENKMIQNAVAQATQQSAAKAASAAVESTMMQMHAQQASQGQGTIEQELTQAKRGQPTGVPRPTPNPDAGAAGPVRTQRRMPPK